MISQKASALWYQHIRTAHRNMTHKEKFNFHFTDFHDYVPIRLNASKNCEQEQAETEYFVFPLSKFCDDPAIKYWSVRMPAPSWCQSARTKHMIKCLYDPYLPYSHNFFTVIFLSKPRVARSLRYFMPLYNRMVVQVLISLYPYYYE